MAKQNVNSGNVAAQVEALVRPIIEEMSLRLWDVRFEKEGADWFLKVHVDDDKPLDTDTCEKVSRAIDPVLDEKDLIKQSYYLEVGSPGLGRRLTRDDHFTEKTGEMVLARLIRPDENGQREVRGILQGKQGDVVTLQTEDGIQKIEMKFASYFKLCDDEDLFG